MYQPQAYFAALLFMLTSMVCWGSWGNTVKLTRNWRFQLLYWDYTLGMLAGALVWGLTLGLRNAGPAAFWHNLAAADRAHLLWALAGGALFNLANLLLVAAIEIAGLAVAFPIGIGLALVVGVLLNYALLPRGNPELLFGGVALVILAILFDAMAYRGRETGSRQISSRGIVISLACGVLMGLFYPLVGKAMTGGHSLGPYSVAFVFAIGVALSSLPANFYLMRKPLDAAPPLRWADYGNGSLGVHAAGWLGGLIWMTGGVFNFVAGHAHLIGPAVSYAIGQGATMVSAIWGVFIWREFAGAPRRSQRLLAWMFVCFVAGLAAVALAPLIH